MSGRSTNEWTGVASKPRPLLSLFYARWKDDSYVPRLMILRGPGLAGDGAELVKPARTRRPEMEEQEPCGSLGFHERAGGIPCRTSECAR